MNVIYSDLKDKAILITGATRGIGKDIAISLAQNNAHVVFNYRGDSSKGSTLKEELLGHGASKVTPLNFDITDFNKMKSEVDSFIKEHGAITGLINNAGISKDQLAMAVKEQDIDELFAVNLKGAMMLTNHLYKNFLRSKQVSIVNISSVVGLMGNRAQTTYAATKAGLIGYTKSIAKELATRDVRANVIAPGFIETEMTKELSDNVKAQYTEMIAMDKFGDTHDVANLVLFLLSSASKYITGEVIKVDGGIYI